MSIINQPTFVSVYRDASDYKPYGARWKALWTHNAGELMGQPLRNDAGNEVECATLNAMLALLARDHGCRPGDVHRVYLPRYEGKEGHYEVSARDFVSALV